MSHLPLDARAILDYLNELGYRNISGEQLKEFMKAPKGMQSQSESYKSKFKAKFSSNNSNSQQQPQSRELHRQQQQRQHQPLQSSTSATTVTKSTAEAERSETAAAVGGNHSSKSTTSLPQQRRATVKVIKCKKPLCHFKFYLDICDHQLAKRIEEQIRTLGGALEFFLTANVTHFITDKAILPTTVGGAGGNSNINNNNNSLSSRPGTPQTPGTPKTPQTPYAGSDTTTTTISTQDGKNNVLTSVCNTPTTGSVSRKSINTRQTRANAILNRVRRASTTTTPNNVNTNSINVNAVGNFVERTPNSPTITTPLSLKDEKSRTVVVSATPPIIISTENPYIIWQTEYALHFFKKVQHELKDYLGNNNNNTHIRHEHGHAHKILYAHKGGRSSTVDPIDLKGGGFLKIESIKRNYRPYYQLFRKSSGTEWPKIELTREDGAFRLSPKKKQQPTTNVKEVIPKTEAHQKERQKIVESNQGNDGDEKDLNMTRKSRSRSSQNQKTQPLHAAVKSLKKSGATVDSAVKVKSSQRNSQAAVGGGGAAAAGCKQAKESSDKQCGVCEICKIEYDTLTIHLKTKDHEYFAKNSQNFIALDSLIHTSADVNKFLSEDKKVTDLEEMEVENFEVLADENAPDPLEGSDPLVGGGNGEAVALPASLIELTDDKRRLAGGAHHTPSPTLREKSKRSTKGKHSSEKFQNIRLSKSPKSTKSATSPIKQNLAASTCTTSTITNTPAPISSSMLELQNIAAKAESANTVKTLKTDRPVPARRKTISASALSPPIRAMLPPSSLYKVVGTPETSVYGTPTRKMRGGELQSGVAGGDGVRDASVTASPSLIVKFKKVRATELNRLNGEAESFMFPKQRTSSELPTDVDRQTTSENAHGRSSSSTSLDTSTSDGECSMDVEEEGSVGRINSSKTTGVKQHTGKRAIATAKRRKDSKAKGTAATKQRFPIAPIQPDIQLKDKQETRKSATVTALNKSQQTAAATALATKTTPTAIKMSKSVSNISTDSPAARRPSAAISAAAAKANAAAAALAAITLPEATRKSSRTATAIVTAATTSSRLLRAAVEAAKYNCRQMAASNERLPLMSTGRKTSTASANEVAVSTTANLPLTSPRTITAPTTKSSYKVPVVKMEDRMGDLRNDKKKKINTKIRSPSNSDVDNEDDSEDYEHAPSSKCIKTVKQNAHINKDLEIKAYGVARRGVDNDDDDDEDDDDEEVDNDDDKDEDYVHCIGRQRKSVIYDNLSALWQSGTINNSSVLSRKQRAAQREEQKHKIAMITTADDIEDSTATTAKEVVKVVGSRRKNSNGTPSKVMKLNNTANAATSSKNKKINNTRAIVDSAQSPSVKPKNNERIKFDLANCTQLNEMSYSFERVPVTDLWYRVFMRQDTCSERFFEYYGSTNYRKLPYELGPIPYARTLNKGCKLCDQDTPSEFMLSDKAKSKICFASSAEVCKVKREPIEQDSEAGASKSRDSSSGKSIDMVANTKNTCTTGSNIKSLETCATSTTTTTTIANSTSNTIPYTHKHKKLAFLQRYRQEQQELQKRQTAATSEQPLNSTQLGDNSNQCDSNASTPTVQDRMPLERKRAGSTHSTTSSTSCASSTATSKTSKNRYFNKHLNKAATAFLNLELPPRKSPREHASTLALVSCIIKQRQDSQSKPNSETDEPPASSTQIAMSAAGAVPTESNMTTKPPTLTAESGDGGVKSSSTATTNSELPTILRSPRHTRSAAATPVEEIRFTTVISENVKRMRRGQNKYDHSPPISHTQRSLMSRKTRRGRPPRTYCGLQKLLNTTESAVAVKRRTSQTSASVLMASAARATTVNTGDRRRRVKHGAGWTSTMGLMAGGGRRQHSSYTGLLAQGSALPSIRKTGSKKGVLEFEVDATAMKALDAATQYANVRHLEWQIDKYLQLYGREYDIGIEDDLALSISESKKTAQEPSPPEVSAINSAISSNTRKCNTTASASTSKKLRRASCVDVKHSASSSTALTQTATEPFEGSTNTPPPTDYFSSDFDLYDLFTNAVKGEGSAASDDEQTVNMNGKRKTTSFSLYSSLAMQNYFRKRKSLKSNRTGWPKVQKKKTSVRQQHMLARKIRFLQDIGELANNNGNGLKQETHVEASKETNEVLEGGDEASASTNCTEIQRRHRGNGVITPPESEMDVKQNNDDCGDEDTEIDAAESVPEGEDEEDEGEEEELEDDGETMAETIDEEDEDEAEAAAARNELDVDAAVEADEEDVEDAELDMYMDVEGIGAATVCEDVADDDDTLMDDDSRLNVTRKRNRRHRRRDSRASPLEVEKRLTTNALITTAHISSSNHNNGATSTPTKQLLRGGSSSSALRRTPQLLNGSLGSCISPSEKAGDNSDIFTVSSDGLDTDLDMSNSQHKCDDEHLHHHHHHHHHHPMHHDQCANHQQTPKRKFDLSKYAPNSAASSSCAAEAATAAVKSLAISQFLKKEVRVQCRRLRAPFRRYRYRR